jgi:hypothetical protein
MAYVVALSMKPATFRAPHIDQAHANKAWTDAFD